MSSSRKRTFDVSAAAFTRRVAGKIGVALRIILLGMPLSAASAFADEPESPTEQLQLERGRFVSNRQFKLGGYGTIRYQDLDQKAWQFDLDNLSLFMTWTPDSKWLLFTELELERSIAVNADGVHSGEIEFDVERLYADYAARPWLNLRVGRFLTPVGRWNLIHADPLVWTTSRPLVTTLLFANQTNGVATHGSITVQNTNTLDYIVYLDESRLIDPTDADESFQDIRLPKTFNTFSDAVGFQTRYHFWNDRAEVALSYANFRVQGGLDRKHLVGVDARVIVHRVELTSELVYRDNVGSHEETEWGGFIQGVVPVIDSIYAIARYERFVGTTSARLQLGTFGVAYRPQSALTLKVEYRLGDDNRKVAPDGVLASITLLY